MKYTKRKPAGHVPVGETFQIVQGGRGYTVHDHAITNEVFSGQPESHYVISVCRGRLYAFDFDREVFTEE